MADQVVHELASEEARPVGVGEHVAEGVDAALVVIRHVPPARQEELSKNAQPQAAAAWAHHMQLFCHFTPCHDGLTQGAASMLTTFPTLCIASDSSFTKFSSPARSLGDAFHRGSKSRFTPSKS